MEAAESGSQSGRQMERHMRPMRRPSRKARTHPVELRSRRPHAGPAISPDSQFRDGFIECADCRVPLAAGFPPEPAQGFDLELVTVLETGDSFALTLAKASLEEAGINYLVSGDEPRYIAGFPGAFGTGATPLCNCSWRIQVAPECESEARAAGTQQDRELRLFLKNPRTHMDIDSASTTRKVSASKIQDLIMDDHPEERSQRVETRSGVGVEPV